MCKVTSINDLENVRKAERRIASIKRGNIISIEREIEIHLTRAEHYIKAGEDLGTEADKFVANGFAKEEIKRADELKRQLEELKK